MNDYQKTIAYPAIGTTGKITEGSETLSYLISFKSVITFKVLQENTELVREHRRVLGPLSCSTGVQTVD